LLPKNDRLSVMLGVTTHSYTGCVYQGMGIVRKPNASLLRCVVRRRRLMARRQLTELDKLECAEYVLELLGKKLQHGEFDMPAGNWIQRCKDECIMRLGEYIGRKGFR
jgi:hypothetical protein